MQDWAYQWKMSFNPGRAKQMQKVTFSRKTNTIIHPTLYFNNGRIKLAHAQKHLGLQPDDKLSFNKRANNAISNVTKGIGILRKMQTILPRRSLLIIYKTFFKNSSWLWWCYDQLSNASFSSQTESVQYNVAFKHLSPVDTWRRCFNVDTSLYDVVSTLKRCRISTGRVSFHTYFTPMT